MEDSSKEKKAEVLACMMEDIRDTTNWYSDKAHEKAGHHDGIPPPEVEGEVQAAPQPGGCARGGQEEAATILPSALGGPQPPDGPQEGVQAGQAGHLPSRNRLD